MKRLLLGLIVLAVLGVAGHQWLLRQAKVALIGSLSEESGYPATVNSFHGFLPFGRIWLQDLNFKNQLPDGQTLDWKLPTATANLRLISYLLGSVEVQDLDIKRASWKTSLASGWTLGGLLNLQGSSNRRPPAAADKDYLWCEHALLTLPSIQGQFKGKSHDLLYDSSLEVTPFCLKGGEFLLPFDFNLAANLTIDKDSACLLAKGKHIPQEKRFQVDIRLVDIEVPVLDRYLGIATQIPGMLDLKVSDWIRSGSVSVQLHAETNPKGVKGDLTLRLMKVQFGKGVTESELTSETLRPILDSIQSREKTLQLGPVSFSENLMTLESEAWDQIQRGMVAELIKSDPGAALKTGAQMLKDFFGK
jgi:hypothetical protein